MRHIHSLMPMDAAARAACVSRTFLSSWRCYPKLILSSETVKAHNTSLGRRIHRILRNHSGIGLKILELHLSDLYDFFPYLDRWLHDAITPGIEELTLKLYKGFSFPCSVLSGGIRSSIRSLDLYSCVFCPTAELGPFRSLTSLCLYSVCITGDELGCLLSNSLALERLVLSDCKEIISLEIPSVMQKLSYMSVVCCSALQIIENKAPSLSSFHLIPGVRNLSLGEASQTMKELSLFRANAICYGRAELPSIMPNLESLLLCSSHEVYCRVSIHSIGSAVVISTVIYMCTGVYIINLNMAYLLCRWIYQCCRLNSSTSSTYTFRLFHRPCPQPVIILLWFLSWMHLLSWRLGGCR